MDLTQQLVALSQIIMLATERNADVPGIAVVQVVRDELSAADPRHASAYADNAERYRAQLKQVAQEVRDHFGEVVLETLIPRSVRISEAPSYGQTVLAYDADGPGARAYRSAAKEVVARWS